ncbi:unnamed protein product [Pedinophyceae sp. YPF-701]|nr:unnamed protein product [Pedinophyceae sp. YPF-701]
MSEQIFPWWEVQMNPVTGVWLFARYTLLINRQRLTLDKMMEIDVDGELTRADKKRMSFLYEQSCGLRRSFHITQISIVLFLLGLALQYLYFAVVAVTEDEEAVRGMNVGSQILGGLAMLGAAIEMGVSHMPLKNEATFQDRWNDEVDHKRHPGAALEKARSKVRLMKASASQGHLSNHGKVDVGIPGSGLAY